MATILTVPVSLSETALDGQMVVLDIDGVQLDAPSKKRPWFRLAIDAVLPPQGTPNNDLLWLMKAKLYVVAVFPDGTLDTSDIEPRPAPEVTDGP